MLNYWVKLLDIGIMVRVFANGLGDLGSIPGQVIPKTQKMVLDATLLNTQHYKVMIKGKIEQSRERSSALPYTSKRDLWATLDYGRQIYLLGKTIYQYNKLLLKKVLFINFGKYLWILNDFILANCIKDKW